MKSRKHILVVFAAVCALVLSLGLFGCGGGSNGGGGGDAPANDAPGTPTTIGYASFNMPDGWAEVQESDSYATIAEEANDDHMMKIFREHLFSGDTIESVAAKKGEMYGTAPGEPVVYGSTTWIPVDFTFNGTPSRFFYSQLDDENLMYVTVYELTDADEPVQTVLSTLSVALPEK